MARRDYAEAELDDRMRRRGFDDEARGAAIERIRELDLLDDERVAETHVRSHEHRKGRLALRRDLRARGLGDAVVERALAPLDEAHQLAAARSVLSKQRWRFGASDPHKTRAKAGTFLARRGFSGDVVAAAIEADFETLLEGARDGTNDGTNVADSGSTDDV